jgi:hypothetical protein
MKKPATVEQRAQWEVIRAVGCIVRFKRPHVCKGYTEIHHTGTNAGGRKNHDKVIPLCSFLHREISRLSLRVWQKTWGTETEHLALLENLLAKRQCE